MTESGTAGAMTTPGERHVRAETVAHVGWLLFDRPPVNAFDWTMVRQVAETFDALAADGEVRVIVLGSANPRYFSAGADLETFAGIDEAGMADWCGLVHGLVRRFRASAKPMLAAIDGVAVGGGLEMTLHCDVRFAAHSARLGQPEVNINFIPPVGATQALVRLIGRPAALRLLYGGELIGAEEALALGLVDELTGPEDLRATVQAYGEALAAKPPEALAAIRRTITEGGGQTFDAGLRIEAEEAVRLAGTANFAEGVAAFLAKRQPDWQR